MASKHDRRTAGKRSDTKAKESTLASKGKKFKSGHSSQMSEETSDTSVAAAGPATKERFTFFYGEKQSPFSQFRAADFEVDGVAYSCAEMYMMHQKAVLFGDAEIAERILQASKPMEMKALGRKAKGFDEETWKQHRRDIVKRGNTAKFSQNADIRAELLATRGTTLVEASPRDRIWGIGLGRDNPKALRRATWRGQNLLGEILTEVREELLRKEEQGTLDES